MKKEKGKTKNEKIEILQLKINYHEKNIDTLEKLIKREYEK